jgi:hypothetical protein
MNLLYLLLPQLLSLIIYTTRENLSKHMRARARSERRDRNGNNLRVAVRDADGSVLDTSLRSGCLSVAVKLQEYVSKKFI